MSAGGRLQGLRLAPELRALIDAAGPLNPAARALLILGAAAAGQPVTPLASTIHALIDRGELSGGTVAALRRLLAGTDSTAAISPAITPAISPPRPAVDALAGVGMEV